MINRGVADCGNGDFCSELAGSTNTTFHTIFRGSPPSRRLATTTSFALVADLSPLLLGHLLLLPKRHYLSFAQVLADHRSELASIVESLRPLYTSAFGMPPTFLEHGSSGTDDRNACITHAHLHLVPISGVTIRDQIYTDGLYGEELPDVWSLGNGPWIDEAYYFIASDETIQIFRPQAAMPRQYIRSVIGRGLGMRDPEWDYALFPRPDIFRETLGATDEWHLSHE